MTNRKREREGDGQTGEERERECSLTTGPSLSTVCSHSQEDFFELSSFTVDVDGRRSSLSKASEARSLLLPLLGLSMKGTGVLD